MKIKDLSVTFHTGKIKECADFYVKYFGAKVVFDYEWYVTIRLQSDPNQPIYLSFMKPEYGTAGLVFSGGITLNVTVEDVDAEYFRIMQTGIKINEEITDHDYGDRAFSVKDPIGNVFYIYSEREIGDKYKDAVKE